MTSNLSWLIDSVIRTLPQLMQIIGKRSVTHLQTKMSGKVRFAVVCSSNMNRSMEAHAFLQKKGYDIHSYGTGEKIKIPGRRLQRLILSHSFTFGC
jgi:hypothetical protein